jgi:hypothetical protein
MLDTATTAFERTPWLLSPTVRRRCCTNSPRVRRTRFVAVKSAENHPAYAYGSEMSRVLVVAVIVLSSFTTAAFAQAPCVADAAQVVNRIYQQVIERPADAGAAELTEALSSGRLTVREAVAAVVGSPEYEMRFFWPTIVSAVHERLLQRPPTQQEMRIATRQLAEGGGPTAFVADTATRAVNNNPNAIRMLYRGLLQREPDPDGLRAYTEMAEQRGVRAVAEHIVASEEYRDKATASGLPLGVDAYAPPVRALYRHLLGREADPGGLQALAEVASVYGMKGPVDRILGSPEYLQQFGENGIPGSTIQFCEPERRAVPRDPRARPRRPRIAVPRQ